MALSLVEINSVESLEEAAKIYEEIGDKKHAQDMWLRVGGNYRIAEKWEQARESLEKALRIAREQNDAKGIEDATANKGFLYLREGSQLNKSGRKIEAIVVLNRALESLQWGPSLEELGQIYLDLGELVKLEFRQTTPSLSS